MSIPVGPAESYARFRERQAAPELASFRVLYRFDFDPFQIAACTALTNGDGVLVAAPTGSVQSKAAALAQEANTGLWLPPALIGSLPST